MADLPDPEEVRDLASSIQSLAQSVSEIKQGFKGIGSSTELWGKFLSEANLTMKGLPKHIETGKDLWKEMIQDAESAKKVQEAIKDLIEDEYIPQIEKAQELGKEGLLDAIQLRKEQESLNKIVDQHVDLAARLRQHQAESNLALLDANKLIKGWGEAIRNPAQGMENMLGLVGQMPQKLSDARKETGSWGAALQKIGKDGFEKIAGPVKALFGFGAGAGIILGGIALATAALTGMFLLFKNFYNFLDKEVVPATADFNKQIGGTNEASGQLKSQMNAVGSEFLLLGMSFEQGAALVRDFAESFKTVKIGTKEMGVAKRMIAEFGVSAKDAGQLFLQFTKQGRGVEDIKNALASAEVAAEGFGVPVNAVIRDMASSPDVMARFGTANSIEFGKATAKAQSYGLSIKDINSAFGEQMDTFDKTATTAANLNAIFGTSINSFELMLETDPTKRLEMLRGELVKNGKEWDQLSKFEQNVITQNLGVSKSQAALILGSEEQRKKLQAQKNEQESLERATARWDEGIGRIKRTLIAWGEEIDALMRSATELVSALFGFEEPGKLIPAITSKISKGFREIRSVMKDWTRQLRGETPSKFIETLGLMRDAFDWLSEKIGLANDVLFPFHAKFSDLVGVLNPLAGIFSSISTISEELTGNFDNLKWAFDLWVTNAKEGLKEFKQNFDSMVTFISSKSDKIIEVISVLNPLGALSAIAGTLVESIPLSTPTPQAKVTPAALRAPAALAPASARGAPAGVAASGGPKEIVVVTQNIVDTRIIDESRTRRSLQ